MNLPIIKTVKPFMNFDCENKKNQKKTNEKKL